MTSPAAADGQRSTYALTRAAVAIVAVILVGAVISLGLDLWREQQRALADAEALAEAYAETLSEHAERTFAAVNAMLVAVAAEAERQRHDPERDPAGIDRIVRGLLPTLPQMTSLGVIGVEDADAPGLPPHQAALRREHLRLHRAEPARGFVVGAPVQDPATGRWSIPASRAIVGPDGVVRGIVLALLAPEQFEAFYASIVRDGLGSLALWHADGIGLARHPRAAGFAGKAVPRPLASLSMHSTAATTLNVVSPVDGRERVAAFRRIPGLPLVVTGAVDQEAVLGRWRRHMEDRVMSAAVMTAVVIILVCLLLRHAARRQVADDRLHRAERRLADIAAAIPGVVYQFRREPDRTDRFTFISEGARALYGLSPAEIVADARSVFDITLAEDMPRVAATIEQSAQDLARWTCEYRIRRAGEIVWLRAESLPRADGDGAIVWNGMVADITAEKRAEAALAAAKCAADAASRAKSEFLANMSHELRTPLNAIIGFAEGLIEGWFGPLNAKQGEYAGDIRAAGKHLLGIIDDVLDLSRLEAGETRLDEAPAEPEAIVAAAATIAGPNAAAKSLALRLAPMAHLPPVQADAVKLKRMLLNLLSNAVKFTPPGGSITVSGGLRRDGALALAVEDTGIGIAAADQRDALRPFHQVGSALTRADGGVGLGLPLVRHFAELHGGAVELRSAPGEGTAVTIVLPPERVLQRNPA